MKTEPNESAYPQQTRSEVMHPDNNNYADPITAPVIEGGLTKREYFAGLAMQGLCNAEPDRKSEFLVKQAVDLADALIKDLNRTES